MLLIDNFFDRLVARLRRSGRQRHNEFISDPSRSHIGTQRSNNNKRRHSMFSGASKFVINQSTFVDRSQIVQMVAPGRAVLDPVLGLIATHTDPKATVDSSARFPPPLCHPGTRLKVGCRLFRWLIDSERPWNMIWLNGPAGTGKSAVAQTFAERCVEGQRLGAAFFFSRSNNRNNPDTVIPSLVYQLAVRLPAYKSIVTAQLANDPQLMWKARHIQFEQLIVKPFLHLQSRRQKRIREPLLIVLDGLDECRGEHAQRDIIEMISGATRLQKDLPLLWLICSRPESHLKHIFSQADYMVNCGREELAIDAESIADVNLYIRDGLAGIKIHFPDTTIPTWPPEEQVTELLRKASGHFGFASTALRYIGDPASGTPITRFDHLLCFLAGARIGTSNPLQALDALYAGILRDIPDEVLQTTKQILGHYIYLADFTIFESVQHVCNFLHIDSVTFYGALQKLHSVIDVPTSETASQLHLRFYHTSFEDYLRDNSRSDGFIFENHTWRDYINICFSWLNTDLELFHINDSPLEHIRSHEHGVLPGLKWVSSDNRAEISSAVAYHVWNCWLSASLNVEWDKRFLLHICKFDFRYIQTWPCGVPSRNWIAFVNKLYNMHLSVDIIRTEPCSEVDSRLLEYMDSVAGPKVLLKPATFPLGERDLHPPMTSLTFQPIRRLCPSPIQAFRFSDYFLIGRGSHAIACWATGSNIIMACGTTVSNEGNDIYKTWFIGDDGNFDNGDKQEGSDGLGSYDSDDDWGNSGERREAVSEG